MMGKLTAKLTVEIPLTVKELADFEVMLEKSGTRRFRRGWRLLHEAVAVVLAHPLLAYRANLKVLNSHLMKHLEYFGFIFFPHSFTPTESL
jgi:hypothetical protein